MKKFVMAKCMNYIKSNTNYDEIKLKEIEYGLLGIYLTLSKLIIILLLSILLGVLKEVILFLLLFNLIRMPAFGLHATKSWICLVGSIIAFIGIPLLCIRLAIPHNIKIFIGIINVLLMLKNAPADTEKRPIVNKKRRTIYKTISTFLSLIFLLGAIIVKNNFLSNCFIFAIALENLLISPTIYKIFKLPYNNYLKYQKV